MGDPQIAAVSYSTDTEVKKTQLFSDAYDAHAFTIKLDVLVKFKRA